MTAKPKHYKNLSARLAAMYDDLVKEQHMAPNKADSIVSAARKRLAGKHHKKGKK